MRHQHYFWGPKLKGFSLRLGLAEPIFESASILESLKICTLSLEYLLVSGPAQLSAVICETARSLQHLRVLKVPYIRLTSEYIHHLSLSNLVELEAALDEDGLTRRARVCRQSGQVIFDSSCARYTN